MCTARRSVNLGWDCDGPTDSRVDEVLLPLMFVFSMCVLSVINLFYGRAAQRIIENTRCSGLSRQRGDIVINQRLVWPARVLQI
ncbi:hypothetical protein TNCV_4936281 [Trichonephila clavipes]|nr:hypothetical protein TNCV_4936281 [Trichonephila clavipes]